MARIQSISIRPSIITLPCTKIRTGKSDCENVRVPPVWTSNVVKLNGHVLFKTTVFQVVTSSAQSVQSPPNQDVTGDCREGAEVGQLDVKTYQFGQCTKNCSSHDASV